MDFKILKSTRDITLVDQIKEKLENGWDFHGPMLINGGTFMQAMVLWDKPYVEGQEPVETLNEDEVGISLNKVEEETSDEEFKEDIEEEAYDSENKTDKPKLKKGQKATKSKGIDLNDLVNGE